MITISGEVLATDVGACSSCDNTHYHYANDSMDIDATGSLHVRVVTVGDYTLRFCRVCLGQLRDSLGLPGIVPSTPRGVLGWKGA